MKITKCFFISSLIVSSSLFSQTLTDAIKQTTNEQFERADASFKNLLTAQPSNGEIYFYYTENFFKNENIEMANATYQKGADVNATNPLPYVGLGKVQWHQGKQADAKANFYKATTLADGKNATVLIKIAEAYINEEIKDFIEANKLLDLAQKLEPKNPEVFLLKGDAVLEQSNDGSKAIAFYEQAAKLDPKSVTAILRIGKLWNRSKNYNAALDSYKKASLIDSSFAPAYREMAEIYARAGQFNNAVAKYKRYLEINKDCDARGRYAGFLLEAKHYAESIDATKEALKCDPNNVYLYRYLAYAYFEFSPPDYTSGLENSNTFFLKANADTKLIPMDYEYHAKLLSKNGKDSLALIDFTKALELQPEKVELNGDIASAYMKMKKWAEAITFFDKKIAGNKANINDYFGLARAYYFSKDFVKADSATSQMIRLQPDLALGYLWKAKVNVQQDLKNEKWLAKPYYEQFIGKVKPEDVEKSKKDLIDGYTYLGVYYINMKDFTVAKLLFQEVFGLDSKNQNGLKFLASPESKKINTTLTYQQYLDEKKRLSKSKAEQQYEQDREKERLSKSKAEQQYEQDREKERLSKWKAEQQYEQDRESSIKKASIGDRLCFSQGWSRTESFFFQKYTAANYTMSIICFIERVEKENYQIRIADISSSNHNEYSNPNINGVKVSKGDIIWVKPLGDSNWHICD